MRGTWTCRQPRWSSIQSPPPAGYDLNGDNVVNYGDRLVWLHDLKKTWVGDSDLNGLFESGDFVLAFQTGEWEVIGATATSVQGGWDGNQLFTSADFVAAFADGGYEVGPRPAAVGAVRAERSLPDAARIAAPAASTVVSVLSVGC